MKLKNIRRCVLMNYNPATKLVDMRHYAIRATPVGLNRGTKKVGTVHLLITSNPFLLRTGILVTNIVAISSVCTKPKLIIH